MATRRVWLGKRVLSLLSAPLSATRRSGQRKLQIGAGAGVDFTNVYANAPANAFPQTVALMADLVKNPTFAAEELERQQAQALDSLRSMGHRVKVGEPWSEGRMSACSQELDAQGRRVLRAGANPRGMQGYAVGR